MTPPTLVAICLGEQLTHGHDLARSAGRPWPIDRSDALRVIPGIMAIAADYVDKQTAKGLRLAYELRFGPATAIGSRSTAPGSQSVRPAAEATVQTVSSPLIPPLSCSSATAGSGSGARSSDGSWAREGGDPGSRCGFRPCSSAPEQDSRLAEPGGELSLVMLGQLATAARRALRSDQEGWPLRQTGASPAGKATSKELSVKETSV